MFWGVGEGYWSHFYFHQEYGESEGGDEESGYGGDGRGVEKYIKI